MASWREVEQQVPELAAKAKAIFDRNKHKTMATLRTDGSPRISGTEILFSGGHLYIGSMEGSQKARDLQRDPRLAIHSDSHPEMGIGDAKLSGRATEINDEATKAAIARQSADEHDGQDPGAYHLFRIDLVDLVVTRVGDPPDHLVIESWTERGGHARVERH